jgi:hypothetical protein
MTADAPSRLFVALSCEASTGDKRPEHPLYGGSTAPLVGVRAVGGPTTISDWRLALWHAASPASDQSSDATIMLTCSPGPTKTNS